MDGSYVQPQARRRGPTHPSSPTPGSPAASAASPAQTAAVDWDRDVPLTDAQVDVFLALEEAAVDPFFTLGIDPTQAAHHGAGEAAAGEDPVAMLTSQLATLGAAKVAASPLPPTHAFNRHLNSLQANVAAVSALKSHLHHTSKLISELDTHTSKLTSTHAQVQSSTDRLMRDKAEIERIASEIEAHLDHFSYLEEFASWVAQSPLPLDNHNEVKQVLARADTCLAFMTTNAHFTDAALYGTRFRQCMTRALMAVRNHIVNALRSVTLAPAGSGGGNGAMASQVDISSLPPKDALITLLATCQTSHAALALRDACQRLAPVMDELTRRCKDHPEYHALRTECVMAYFTVRWQVVGPVVDQMLTCIKRLEAEADPTLKHEVLVQQVEMTSSGLVTLVEEEKSEFARLFGSDHVSDMDPLIENITSPINSYFRPLVLSSSSLPTLSQICFTLLPPPAVPGLPAPSPVLLASLLSDAQHRLVFRSQHFLAATLGPVGSSEYSTDMRELVCQVLACLNGSVADEVVQVIAQDCVPLLVQRVLATKTAGPAPPAVGVAGESAISKRRGSMSAGLSMIDTAIAGGAGSNGTDLSLLELQLFRVHELAKVLDTVQEVPALNRPTTMSDPSAHHHDHQHQVDGRQGGTLTPGGGASIQDLLAVANNARIASSSSLLGSMLGLDPSTSPSPTASNPRDGPPPTLASSVDAALHRARDDLLLDRVHACTYQLKRFLVRVASIGADQIDPAQQTWASKDALLQLAREWHSGAEMELKVTHARVQAYLSDVPVARLMVLRPLVESVAVVYRDFVTQVARIHGGGVGAGQAKEESAFWAGFMSVEACVRWVQQTVCV
ncbi:Sec34-like family-domain-containing protein [Catenaria anguillulae PL171]|uniref:Conserved oligomeric Golgi complex subunit 3 n=1 Tax=Catenaria anguillulae PL171 TaxID=765915 RepID=A0A1Y2HVS8_9FUNG|nr:Sec34-like family-domain-containing protein [Catenaria anguillulae PL171]